MQEHDIEMTEVEETPLHDAVKAHMEEQAQKLATKILRKNKREIARLKKHGEYALLLGNKEAYIYAINKLRKIHKQKQMDTVLADTMWETSRQVIFDIVLKK